MKNVLITGGAGFIGSNLALQLIEKGYTVTVLDNLSPQIHGDNPENSALYCSIKNEVNFIKGSVTSKNDWEKALKDQNIVVHLAAETGTGQSMYEITKYTEVNIQGTSIFLDILTNQNHSIEKIVVASSRAIYGEGKYKCEEHGYIYPESRDEDDLKKGFFDLRCPYCHQKAELMPTDEESKQSPASIYGITKQVQEEMFLTVGKSLNIPAVAFRYQNVYGPGQSLKNPYTGILSIFSTRIKNGNSLNIFEDGLESRDFVYIDDVVNATILGIEKKEANFHVFNVGTGQPVTVLNVADELINGYGMDVDVMVSGNYRLGDIRHNIADLTKIKNYLGFNNNFTFKEGIKNFIEWVNKQEINKDNYQNSIDELKRKGLFK